MIRNINLMCKNKLLKKYYQKCDKNQFSLIIWRLIEVN